MEEENEIVGAERALFQGIGNNHFRMNIVLQSNNQVKALDSSITALARNVVQRETYKSLVNNLKWIKSMYLECDILILMKQVWRVLNRDKSNLIHSVYCIHYQEKVVDGKKATRLCACGSCGPGLGTKYLGRCIRILRTSMMVRNTKNYVLKKIFLQMTTIIL